MEDRERLLNRDDSGPTDFYSTTLRPCIAEFIGVMLFVFIGTLTVVSTAGVPGSLLAIALSHGLGIALLVIAIGGISGAHLNPAVTLGIYLAGAITPLKAVLYVISQLLGGLVGAALTRGISTAATFKLVNGGAQTLSDTTGPGRGLLCEVMLTALLVLVVLLAAVDDVNKNPHAPLAIGFAVTIDIMAGGPITGASMNPARSFGPAVAVSTYNSDIWSYHWIYWLGPALGALLATVWYRFFLASPERRIFRSRY